MMIKIVAFGCGVVVLCRTMSSNLDGGFMLVSIIPQRRM